VSLLGKAISGQGGLQKSWPRYEQPLSTVQVTNLQQRLTSAGFDTKGADGVIGTNTRKAFQRWQAANGQTPDGFISQRSASTLIW
jgi:peptidoglycan hydrolase-like protein with peptidoglycan-binding domain